MRWVIIPGVTREEKVKNIFEHLLLHEFLYNFEVLWRLYLEAFVFLCEDAQHDGVAFAISGWAEKKASVAVYPHFGPLDAMILKCAEFP